MRRIIFFFLCIIFSCCFFSAVAQTHTIDSLKKEIIKAKNPQQKLAAIFSLCEWRQSLNTDTLFYYAAVAKFMSLETHDESKIALADYFISNCLIKQGQMDNALKIIKSHLANLNYDSNPNLYLKFGIQLGQIYIKSNHYKDAYQQFYHLLTEAEERQDTITQVSAKTSIGWINMEMGQNTEALNWFYKALRTTTNPSLFKRYSVVYSNMAATYNELGQNDSAEFYIKKAIRNSRETEDLQFLANALAIQADIFLDTKRSDLAESSLTEALNIRRQIGEAFYIVSDMTQLALFYAQNGQSQKGIALSLEGIRMANDMHVSSKLPILYDALGANYKAAGNYNLYGQTLQKIIELKDSMYRKNSAESLAEIQAKYDLQKKENIIIQQKLDLVKKNYLFYGLLLLVLMILGVAWLVFKGYRKRQRLKMDIMREDEKQISMQVVREAEEAERKRIAADLHDNLGAYAASIVSNLDQIIYKTDSRNMIAMQELRNNSQSIVSQLSDTIWALKKNALCLTALSDRIKVFIQRIQSSYPEVMIDVFENIKRDPVLSPSQAFHLFSIIQEGINNSLKHSQCRQVMITVEGKEQWKITISDNGKGMIHKAGSENGSGLSNMIARSKESGWQIEWQNNEPTGTCVMIEPTTN